MNEPGAPAPVRRGDRGITASLPATASNDGAPAPVRRIGRGGVPARPGRHQGGAPAWLRRIGRAGLVLGVAGGLGATAYGASARAGALVCGAAQARPPVACSTLARGVASPAQTAGTRPVVKPRATGAQVAGGAEGAAAAGAELPGAPPRNVLQRYCFACHNARTRTAGLALDTFEMARAGDHPEVWEAVVRKLRTGAMPPAGRPRPDRATYDAVVAWLETALDRAAEARPNPGRPTLHRLNRAEYRNAVRDLLAVEIDAELLPADNAAYGFDNNADALTLSPALTERYLGAAARIAELALGRPRGTPAPETILIPTDRDQGVRWSDELPFGSRGGGAFRYHFPAGGDYLFEMRPKESGVAGGFLGVTDEPHQLDVSIDGERVWSGVVRRPEGARGDERNRRILESMRFRAPVSAGPHLVQVYFAARTSAYVEDLFDPDLRRDPYRAASGEPVVSSVTITGPLPGTATPGDSPSRRKLLVCSPAGRAPSGGAGRAPAPAGSAPAGRGPARAAGRAPAPAESVPARPAQAGQASAAPTPAEQVPAGRTPTGRAPGTPGPAAPSEAGEDAAACARTIITRLARRAYRRPVNGADLDVPLALYRDGAARGGFEAGIELAVRGILVSPNFLFRFEEQPASAPPGTPYRITDLELASRLSFFLWSSVPDDQLIDVAVAGELHRPDVLRRQVARMLADPRAQALVDNFAGQWLHVRNVPGFRPSPELLFHFDDNLRQAFAQETSLFFASIVRENRSVLDLLDADYTFLNERLARHYGIPGVHGERFRRVTLPPDSVRRGLLGQGSILTGTSRANRTSPVIRGKWILENLLGTPPPPPPPDVPDLVEERDPRRVLPMREQLALHRANPVCAACHAQMDQLGSRPRELRRHRRVARHLRLRPPHRRLGGVPRRHHVRRPQRAPRAPSGLRGRLPAHRRRPAADLRPRPRPRSHRHARRPPHPARRRARRSPLRVPRPGCRGESPLPDADGAGRDGLRLSRTHARSDCRLRFGMGRQGARRRLPGDRRRRPLRGVRSAEDRSFRRCRADRGRASDQRRACRD